MGLGRVEGPFQLGSGPTRPPTSLQAVGSAMSRKQLSGGRLVPDCQASRYLPGPNSTTARKAELPDQPEWPPPQVPESWQRSSGRGRPPDLGPGLLWLPVNATNVDAAGAMELHHSSVAGEPPGLVSPFAPLRRHCPSFSLNSVAPALRAEMT